MILEQAKINDYLKIVKFIKVYWEKNHILTKNKKLFYFYYLNKKKLNFLILKNNRNQITSILGYLIDNKKFAWLALWISKPDALFGGVRLLKELEKKFKDRILVLGLSRYAEAILKKLNYKVFTMNHYYFVNNKFKYYRVISNPITKKYKLNKKIFFSQLKKKEVFKFKSLISKRNTKNFSDFKFKYLNNKFYDYNFFLLKKNKDKLILVLRQIFVDRERRNILRIVDAFGNFKLFEISNNFYQYLFERFKSEYLDILNLGIDEKIFFKSGMVKANYNKTIIPNYFEPFSKKNKKIIFAHNKNIKKKLYVFKGDGDQERPNLI